jgi:hypothetical protein
MAATTRDVFESVLSIKPLGFDDVQEQAGRVQEALEKLSKLNITIGGDPRKTKRELGQVLGALDSVFEQATRVVGMSKKLGYGFMGDGKQQRKLMATSKEVSKIQTRVALLQTKLNTSNVKVAKLQKSLAKDKSKGWAHEMKALQLEAALAERESGHGQAELKEELKMAQFELQAISTRGAAEAAEVQKLTKLRMEQLEELNEFRDRTAKEHVKEFSGTLEDAYARASSGDFLGLIAAAHDFSRETAKAAEVLAAKGRVRGGVRGKAEELTGKSLAAVVKTVAKVAAVVGGLALVFTLMKDAMDMIQDMNTSTLEAAGAMALAYDKAEGFVGGAERMQNLLKEVNTAVMDQSVNWQLGTTAKDQLEILKLYERQNITIAEMKENMDSTEMKKFTDYTSLAVKGARALGLDYSETVEAISVFTRDLGVNIGQVDELFYRIGADAIDARMNVKEFFSAVTQASTSMALYGNRIAETSSFLGTLSKALGPTQAKEALDSMVNSWKKMDDNTRMQNVLLGGLENRLRDLRLDAKDTFEGMYQDLKAALGREVEMGDIVGLTSVDMAKIRGFKGNRDLINQVTAQKRLQESIAAGEREGPQATVAVAEAMMSAGPATALEGFFDVAETLFKKPIVDLTALEAKIFREQQGLSMDEFVQMQKIQGLLLEEKGVADSALVKLIGGEFDKLTEEEKAIVGSTESAQRAYLAHIEAASGGAVTADDLKNLPVMAYFRAARPEKQAEMTEQLAEVRSVEEAGLQATRKISSVLENVTNRLLFELGQVLTSIWKGVVKFFAEDVDEQERNDYLDRASKLEIQKNELADLYKSSTESAGGKVTLTPEQRDTYGFSTFVVTGAEIVKKQSEIQEKLTFAARQIEQMGFGLSVSREDKSAQFGETPVADVEKITGGKWFNSVQMGIEGLEGIGVAAQNAYMERRADAAKTSYPVPATAKASYEAVRHVTGVFGQDTDETRKLGDLPGERVEVQANFDKKFEAYSSDFKNSMLVAQKASAAVLGDSVTKDLWSQYYDFLNKQETAGKSLAEREEGGFAFFKSLDTVLAVNLPEILLSNDDKLETIKKLLSEPLGMELEDKKDLAKIFAAEFVDAQTEADVAGLATQLGMTQVALKQGMVQNTPPPGMTSAQTAAWQRAQPKITNRPNQGQPAQVKSAPDAYFPQGGLVRASAGDYLIHQSAFTSGGKGSMLDRVTGGIKQVRSGGGATVVNININGGDVHRIKQVVIETIQGIERKRLRTLPAEG